MRRNSNILRLLCLLAMFTVGLTVRGQDEAELVDTLDEDRVEMLSRIQIMIDDLKQIYVTVQHMPPAGKEGNVRAAMAKAMVDRLKVADRTMKKIDFQWDTYYQTIQPVIAEDEELMDAASDLQQLEQVARDSLDKRIQRADLLLAFCKAEAFIPAQEQSYKDMFSQAMKLSFVSKLAPQLEKLKGKEQVQFSVIQEQYDKAKEASATMPSLLKRMAAVEQYYIVLKDTSEKIQAAVYKPLIQRVKDYLMGLAAVAIILMFMNMLTSKLQSLKKARESAKKMKEMMKNGGSDTFYPTI